MTNSTRDRISDERLKELAEPAWANDTFTAQVESMARELLVHRAAEAQRPTWQPIETAPKDGTRIILLEGSRVMIGYWADHAAGRYWVEHMGRCHPHHWMPLPAPPDGGTDR